MSQDQSPHGRLVESLVYKMRTGDEASHRLMAWVTGEMLAWSMGTRLRRLLGLQLPGPHGQVSVLVWHGDGDIIISEHTALIYARQHGWPFSHDLHARNVWKKLRAELASQFHGEPSDELMWAVWCECVQTRKQEKDETS